MAFDWNQVAVGGAQRPDSFTGLDPAFSTALEQMFRAAPPEIQPHLRVTSGYRSPQRQEQLWQSALAKYGSPEAARKWVAPPGRSKHNHGQAVDLKYLDPAATAWAHENAAKFGLHFPLGNENWHIEPLGSRGGHDHAPQAPGTPAPPMGAPVQVAERPVAQPMASEAPTAPAGQPQQPEQSGLGAMMAALAPAAKTTSLADAPQVAERVLTDAGAGVALAAAQNAEQAKGLQASLMPDVAALIGLSGPGQAAVRKPRGPMMV